MPIVSGATPATAHETRRASGRRPSSAAFSGCVTMHTAAPSFWPLALPAVTVASGSLRAHDRAQRGEPLERRVGARVLVALDDAARPCGRRRSRARSPRRTCRPRCAATARWCERSASSSCSLARDRVLAAQVLGRLDHPARHRVVRAAGGHARPRASRSCELDAAALDAPAHAHRVELGLAHALGAAGEHEVGGAGLHLHAGEHDRLQPRAAAAVELQPGHLDAADRRRARRRGRSPAPRRWGSTGRGSRRRSRSAAARCAARARAITVAASFAGGTSRNTPPKPPTGVRSGSQMTASRMGAEPATNDRARRGYGATGGRDTSPTVALYPDDLWPSASTPRQATARALARARRRPRIGAARARSCACRRPASALGLRAGVSRPAAAAAASLLRLAATSASTRPASDLPAVASAICASVLPERSSRLQPGGRDAEVAGGDVARGRGRGEQRGESRGAAPRGTRRARRRRPAGAVDLGRDPLGKLGRERLPAAPCARRSSASISPARTCRRVASAICASVLPEPSSLVSCAGEMPR